MRESFRAVQTWYYPGIGSPSLSRESGVMTEARRKELGDFLRSRRERLSPASVGLAAVRRRRTPGLRREEVAELAGVGIDWDVRPAQSRDVRPSLTPGHPLA